MYRVFILTGKRSKRGKTLLRIYDFHDIVLLSYAACEARFLSRRQFPLLPELNPSARNGRAAMWLPLFQLSSIGKGIESISSTSAVDSRPASTSRVEAQHDGGTPTGC